MHTTAALVATLALTLTGCAGGSSTPAAPADSPRAVASSAAPTKTAAAKASRCLPVTAPMLAQIASLPEAGTSFKLRDGWAVRSTDFAKVWMISAELVGPDLDGERGVWAANGLTVTTGTTILAVDGFAQQFTTWTDGGKSGAHIGAGADGVEAVGDCA